jgi:serine/threonine protein kinase
MELVEGEDLAQRPERGPIPADEVLRIARQIAEALEAAREAGIVHRDLKPANIKVWTSYPPFGRCPPNRL